MDSRVSLSGVDLADMPILYVLLAIVILLTLLAALGTWVRGGGLKKQDAESLFSESRERQREEIARLETMLEQTRQANEDAQQTLRQVQERNHELMTARLQEVDQQVQRSRSGMEAALSQASAEYTEALSDELEMVARKLGETDRRLSNGLQELNGSLTQIQNQVAQAGEQIRSALIEITRQQQEQKAQSTIQLCEALISSLGTLKNSIAHQLVDSQNQPVSAEFSMEEHAQTALPGGAGTDTNEAAPTDEQIAAVDPVQEDVAQADPPSAGDSALRGFEDPGTPVDPVGGLPNKDKDESVSVPVNDPDSAAPPLMPGDAISATDLDPDRETQGPA